MSVQLHLRGVLLLTRKATQVKEAYLASSQCVYVCITVHCTSCFLCLRWTAKRLDADDTDVPQLYHFRVHADRYHFDALHLVEDEVAEGAGDPC